MNFKKIVSILTAVTLTGSLLLSSAASAATSEAKIDTKTQEDLVKAAGTSSSNTVSVEVKGEPGTLNDESAVKIKKDEAVKIAEKMLEDPDQFILTNVGLNPGYGSSSANWSLSFNSKDPNSSNASVTVDADTGRILNFNIWFNQFGQKNYIATLTRAEASKIAEDFLRNKMKVDLATYELQQEDPYAYGYKVNGVKEMVSYSFMYARKVNGVYLSNDTLYVSVDGTYGNVTSFSTSNIQADLTKLPDKSKAITADAALIKFKNILNISLQYINIFPTNPYTSQTPKTMLVYAPIMSADMVDAVSGKSIGYDGKEIDLGFDPGELYLDPKQIVPSAVQPKGAEITDEDASKMAEGVRIAVEKLIGTKFNNDSSYPKQLYYGASSDSWTYNWYKNQDNISFNLSLTISKKTGLISNLGFGRNKYVNEMGPVKDKPREIKEKINWKQGKDKALTMFKQLMPEQYGLYSDMNLTEPKLDAQFKKTMQSYTYSYLRLINGILYRDNNINISIDRETGNVEYFYGNWTDIETDSLKKTITKDEAIGIFLKGIEPRLTYFQIGNYDISSGLQKFDAVPILVYTFSRNGSYYGSNSYIDAVTGKLLDYSGREIAPSAQADLPKSKDGWADRSIELLIAQGIIKAPFPDFEADLTRGEAIKMLSLAIGQMYYYDAPQPADISFSDVPKDSDYYYFVENAVRQGIISKGGDLKPDEKITKAEFVKLLVNLLGYSDIAKKSEIFKLDGINVINAGDVGSTAICSALDLLPVKTGSLYDGNSSITYAEACSAFYKALKYIR